MIFEPKRIILKDGRACILRPVELRDAADMLAYLEVTSGETPFLLRYPDEVTYTMDAEEQLLKNKRENLREFMMVAEVDSDIAGNCGIMEEGVLRRIMHRCEFAIAIKKSYWNLGIGSALMDYALALAAELGYEQVELEVVEGNHTAKSLYEKKGFVEVGFNPKAMKYDDGTYRGEYSMIKSL